MSDYLGDDGYGGGPEEPEYVGHNNALVQVPGARLPMPKDAGVEAHQWRVFTEAIWPGAKTPEAIKLALDYCKSRHLDPLKRPVHIVPMYNSSLGRKVETIWPGISELQTTAARTGEWAGMDDPRWGPLIEETFHGRSQQFDKRANKYVWRDDEPVTLTYPEWCSVTVYRIVKGHREPFSEPVYWKEHYVTKGPASSVPNSMWEKRTRGQLAKCAKAASLRAAFPEETGNQYTSDEMEGKDTEGGIVIPGSIEPQSSVPPPPPPNRADFEKPQQDDWLAKRELELVAEKDGFKQARLLQQALRTARTTADVRGLTEMPAVKVLLASAPRDIRAEMEAAFGAAAARLTEGVVQQQQISAPAEDEPSVPPFVGYLVDENGNPVRHEPYLDPVSFARAAFDYYRTEGHPDGIAGDFFAENEKAMKEARANPEASRIMDDMLAYGNWPDTTEDAETEPEPSPVVPKQDRSGKPDWAGYQQEMLAALTAMRGRSLERVEAWLEAQRPQLEQAPSATRLRIVWLITEWLTTNTAPEVRQGLAPVLGSLAVKPRAEATKTEPKSSDEAMADNMIARLAVLHAMARTDYSKAKQQFDLLAGLDDTKELRQRLTQTNPQLAGRLHNAFQQALEV